jgi:hypothetical protein
LVKRVVELAEKIGSNEIIAVVRIFKRANWSCFRQ